MSLYDHNFHPNGSMRFPVTLRNGTVTSFSLDEYRAAMGCYLNESSLRTAIVLTSMRNTMRLVAYSFVQDRKSANY